MKDDLDIKAINKELKKTAINIKGKEYSMVKDRILAFNENYPLGHIETEVVKNDELGVLFQARVYPDTKDTTRYFTGHSEALRGDSGIAGQSSVEVAETSAVGRALAMMGIGVLDSVASVDEIHKAESVKMMVDKKDADLVEAVLDMKPDDSFVLSVAEGLKKYGKLTEKQREAMQKILDKEWEGDQTSERD